MPQSAWQKTHPYSDTSVDFLPMTLRTRLLITALFLCHQLPASSLVTSQLLAQISGQPALPISGSEMASSVDSESISGTPCGNLATTVLNDGSIICAVTQEKVGDLYKLKGNAEIHYRTYVLRADELTYNRNTGEATATGHFTIDGGPNDDHIRASHGTYNVAAETGRFYNVTATTGLKFTGSRTILTSTAP